MLGAIIGDIVGSPYEFDRGNKTKEFPLIMNGVSKFTDDTVMTVAIADALVTNMPCREVMFKSVIIASMKKYANEYPRCSYGNRFSQWLYSEDSLPYGSWGNGSAMRVSSIAWLYNSIEKVRQCARWSAEVTHNHPEGIKGAEAVASAIFLARAELRSKETIKEYIEDEFGYDLNRTCDEIRPSYRHFESCEQTVPQAIIAFLESNDFEDTIRNAVSLGGDCDTVAAMAGSIAEAYYGIPYHIKKQFLPLIPDQFLEVTDSVNFITGRLHRK